MAVFQRWQCTDGHVFLLGGNDGRTHGDPRIGLIQGKCRAIVSSLVNFIGLKIISCGVVLHRKTVSTVCRLWRLTFFQEFGGCGALGAGVPNGF